MVVASVLTAGPMLGVLVDTGLELVLDIELETGLVLKAVLITELVVPTVINTAAVVAGGRVVVVVAAAVAGEGATVTSQKRPRSPPSAHAQTE